MNSREKFISISSLILGLMIMAAWNAYNTPEIICNRVGAAK